MTAGGAKHEITEAAQTAGRTPKTLVTKVMQQKEIRGGRQGQCPSGQTGQEKLSRLLPADLDSSCLRIGTRAAEGLWQ